MGLMSLFPAITEIDLRDAYLSSDLCCTFDHLMCYPDVYLINVSQSDHWIKGEAMVFDGLLDEDRQAYGRVYD